MSMLNYEYVVFKTMTNMLFDFLNLNSKIG